MILLTDYYRAITSINNFPEFKITAQQSEGRKEKKIHRMNISIKWDIDMAQTSMKIFFMLIKNNHMISTHAHNESGSQKKIKTASSKCMLHRAFLYMA